MLPHSFEPIQQDAFTRQAMEEKREEYERYWVRKTQLASIVTILTGCVLMASMLFFVNFTGIVAGVFEFLGARKRKSEFLFVSFVLLSIAIFKNLVIIYFLLALKDNELSPHINYTSSEPQNILNWVQICLYFAEPFLILPYALHKGVFLYKTLSADTIFQSEAWSNA